MPWQTVHNGAITARIRECWVWAENRRVSFSASGLTLKPTIHSLVIEYIGVDESERRQGIARRFIEQACNDARFEMVIVEGVQNPILAEALIRWGWDYDPGVMDFYHAGGQHANLTQGPAGGV